MPPTLRFRLVPIVAALLALLAASDRGAAARPLELFAPPEGFALATPRLPTGGGPLTLYSATKNDARWYIAQWGISGGQLAPFKQEEGSGGTIYQANAPGGAVRAQGGNGGFHYTLTQNGAELPCKTAAGKPLEFDLLASTSGHAVAPGTPAAALVAPDSVPLSRMRRLIQTITLRVVKAGRAAVNKRCQVNQGGAFVAVVLRNSATRPGQTLFYKMTLAALCGPGPQQRMCESRTGIPTFYSKTNPFGYDDWLPAIEQRLLVSGEQRTLNIDLLPRLTRLILSGQNGLDRNLSHWVVDGAYHGSHIWGDVVLATEWSGYHLVADVP